MKADILKLLLQSHAEGDESFRKGSAAVRRALLAVPRGDLATSTESSEHFWKPEWPRSSTSTPARSCAPRIR